MKNKVIIICLVLSMLLCCFGCDNKGKNSAYKNDNFGLFDTFSSIYSFAGDGEKKFDKNSKEAYELLYEYHQLFDIYNEYEGVNNIYTINQNAGKNPVKVDKKLIEFLLFCKDLYYKTNGKVNVMLGSVLQIWHKYRTEGSNIPEDAKIPELSDLEEANLHTSIELLVIDEVNSTVYIADEKASLDVGAIGKGYATEKAAQYLKSKGCDGYVLDIGGNLRIIGTKHVGTGDGWVTGIRDPQESTSSALKLYLSNISCVTSGVYERYYVVNNERYHHIIDPETLFPAKYYDSVSIICDDSGLSDALSTALFATSHDECLEIIKNFDIEIGVIWIYSSGKIDYTSNIEDLIVE